MFFDYNSLPPTKKQKIKKLVDKLRRKNPYQYVFSNSAGIEFPTGIGYTTAATASWTQEYNEMISQQIGYFTRRSGQLTGLSSIINEE
jgi:hypothetical protein